MGLLPVNEITRLEQLDLNASYSYVDYLKWRPQERIELIKGKIIVMSLAPTRLHQNNFIEINRTVSKSIFRAAM